MLDSTKRWVTLGVVNPITHIFTPVGGSGGGGGGGGGGSGGPPWVDAACPNLTAPVICLDFVNNQAWDGLAGATVPLSGLLRDTRAGSIPYDPGNGIVTTIPPNTLPIGAGGLAFFPVWRQLPAGQS